MSAILAPVAPHTDSVLTPVAASRAALDAAVAVLEGARRELSALDSRIRAYQVELDQREIDRERYTVSVRTAVAHNQPVPKPPKVKPSDAAVVLPILKGQRVALEERVIECQGQLRRACVEEVERRYADALEAFAVASGSLIGAWRELIGAHALLEQAGVRAHVVPLPPSLHSEFAIPVVGRLRAICANHWAHFLASHAIAQGELTRAMNAVRARAEREIAMKLPW